MALCCAICYEHEGPNAITVETGWDSAQAGVCPRCVAKIELERARLAMRVPEHSRDVERAIGDARRALGDDAFLSELPPVPERGFVGIELCS
jgi:hypothetical protein